MLSAKFAQNADAIHSRHVDVEDAQGGTIDFDSIEKVRAVLEAGGIETAIGKILADHFAKVRLVIAH